MMNSVPSATAMVVIAVEIVANSAIASTTPYIARFSEKFFIISSLIGIGNFYIGNIKSFIKLQNFIFSDIVADVRVNCVVFKF